MISKRWRDLPIRRFVLLHLRARESAPLTVKIVLAHRLGEPYEVAFIHGSSPCSLGSTRQWLFHLPIECHCDLAEVAALLHEVVGIR